MYAGGDGRDKGVREETAVRGSNAKTNGCLVCVRSMCWGRSQALTISPNSGIMCVYVSAYMCRNVLNTSRSSKTSPIRMRPCVLPHPCRQVNKAFRTATVEHVLVVAQTHTHPSICLAKSVLRCSVHSVHMSCTRCVGGGGVGSDHVHATRTNTH